MEKTLRNSFAFFAATAAIGMGLFALDYLPEELYLFDLRVDTLSFFRAPLDQFYLSVFFSWIEWLRRAQVLAPILALLTLATIAVHARLWEERTWFLSLSCVIAHLLLTLALLPKASLPHAVSLPAILLFLALFWGIHIFLPRNIIHAQRS